MAIAGVISWQVSRQREPRYQGIRLTVWLKQYGTNHWSTGRDGPLEKEAQAAIRQVGTNAIPLYLSIMSARESPLKRKLLALAPRPLVARLHLRSLYSYRLLGAYGLIALGPDAKPAVPALMGLLTDKDAQVRYPAVFALRCLGPAASDALPSLITCLKDPEFIVRDEAVLALGTIHQQPDQVVPILVGVLDQAWNPQNSAILWLDAMSALREFGTRAKPAVPRLLNLLGDEHEDIRSLATNTLMVIDPGQRVLKFQHH